MPELPQVVYECATTSASHRQRRETVQRLTAAPGRKPHRLRSGSANLADNVTPGMSTGSQDRRYEMKASTKRKAEIIRIAREVRQGAQGILEMATIQHFGNLVLEARVLRANADALDRITGANTRNR